MVGSTGTLMTMRFVRSKLRKREETSAVSPPVHHVEAQLNHHQLSNNNNNNINHHNNHNQQQPSQILSTEQQGQQNGIQPVGFRQTPQSVWVFPPLPPQPNIYCINNHDALAHLNDKSGFKGFRKQFSGRFKRLVAKKSPEPTAVIPPELKPQLKTIYVY